MLNLQEIVRTFLCLMTIRDLQLAGQMLVTGQVFIPELLEVEF